MKKFMKKSLAVLLSLVCVMSMVAVNVSAATSSGKCGENLTWTLDSAGTLTISGTGEMYGDQVFVDMAYNIKTIIICDGVTSIGSYAFQPCVNLTSVSIPDSVTQISNFAFAGCSNLTNITIPDSVTKIGGGAFIDCYKLSNIIIPNSITSIGVGAFSECHSLTNIMIPNSITSIEDDMFYGCSGLTSITIPNSVTSIGFQAFYGCSSLTNVTIPSSVTSIDYGAFDNCENLTDVYYEGSEAQRDEITIGKYNEPLLNATWHYGQIAWGGNNELPEVVLSPAKNGYNRGEETYKFTNYADFHFDGFSLEFGHCFGMAVTSSGYYVNLININEKIGISDSSKLYAEAKDDHEFFKIGTNVHTDPICHYQSIQGSSFKKSIVAGGSWWGPLSEPVDLVNDWNEVVAYVQDGSHNAQGDLIVVYKGDISGQHAVNLLKCEGSGDDAKIYVYDNNFPEDDNIYFYKKDGKVYCNFSSGSPEEIRSLCLCDIAKYLNIVDGVSLADIVYAEEGNVKVTYTKDGETKEAEEFIMIGCEDPVVMHEIEPEAKEVVVTPLVDDAQFVYIENTYTVDKGEEVVLEKPASDEEASAVKVQSKRKAVTLEKKATVTLTPSVYVDEGYTVSYTSSDAKVVTVDEKGVVTAVGTGSATVTCTVKDENGNTVAEDTYAVTVTGSSVNWIIVIILAAAVLAASGAVTVIIIRKRKRKDDQK